jgi:hypothetical protein
MAGDITVITKDTTDNTELSFESDFFSDSDDDDDYVPSNKSEEDFELKPPDIRTFIDEGDDPNSWVTSDENNITMDDVVLEEDINYGFANDDYTLNSLSLDIIASIIHDERSQGDLNTLPNEYMNKIPPITPDRKANYKHFRERYKDDIVAESSLKSGIINEKEVSDSSGDISYISPDISVNTIGYASTVVYGDSTTGDTTGNTSNDSSSSIDMSNASINGCDVSHPVHDDYNDKLRSNKKKNDDICDNIRDITLTDIVESLIDVICMLRSYIKHTDKYNATGKNESVYTSMCIVTDTLQRFSQELKGKKKCNLPCYEETIDIVFGLFTKLGSSKYHRVSQIFYLPSVNSMRKILR